MHSTSLRSTLDSLASSFASAVLDAIRVASIDDLLGESAGGAPRRGPGRPRASTTRASAGRSLPSKPTGRLPRRSPEDIAKTLGLVIAAVKAGPMRAEQIRKFLKLDRRELPRVLAEGMKTKKLKSKGKKRATLYFPV